MQSNLFKLNLRDIGHAFLITFLGTFLTAAVAILDAGSLPTLSQLGAAAVVGLTSGVSYIIKKFFTNSENKLAITPEPK